VGQALLVSVRGGEAAVRRAARAVHGAKQGRGLRALDRSEPDRTRVAWTASEAIHPRSEWRFRASAKRGMKGTPGRSIAARRADGGH
jgi:hypothetical protein